MILKCWNKKEYSDRKKGLNSFSIYLLLLAFMLHNQYMINLQALAPKKKIRVPREIDKTEFMLEPEIQFLKDMDEIDQK